MEISGRQQELEALARFAAGVNDGAALLLTGPPGAGKTTLWEAGVEAARERRLRVLEARSSGAETRVSFAGVADLLGGMDDAAVHGLPLPQRHALEVASMRAEPSGTPPEPRAIAMGLLGALRALGARAPVLVAIDDVPWLDSPSAEALSFAARRLDGEAVRFMLARRPGRASPLERALEPRLETLEIGPLGLEEVRHLLAERLGLSLRRHQLRRIVDSTLGNPLFALELGRTIAEGGSETVGGEIPVPDRVEDLLGTRVAQLPPTTSRLLLALALSADLRVSQLLTIADEGSFEDAVEDGLVVVEGDRVRASHPLLAAAARKRSTARARRELHRTLAGVLSGQELRARHLAMATERPDPELAVMVSAAAAAASRRGARQEAVELADHALRLTRRESPERSDRLLELAGYLDIAGDVRRVTDMLAAELPSLPPGAPRARAWLILAEGADIKTLDDYKRHLAMALSESEDEPGLRALVVARGSTAVIGVERIPEAEAEAVELLRVAEGADPRVERLVLFTLAWARGLRGRGVDDLCEWFDAASGAAPNLIESPTRIAAQRRVWRGELDEARELCIRSLALADERAEPASYAIWRLHLCELELRIGNWDAAGRLLDEWAESSDRELLIPPMYERCRALLAVGRGRAAEGERWGASAVDRATAIGVQWDWLEGLRARGSAALLAGEPARAVESLGTVWEHARREGVDEPGVFPVAPDLVEAQVTLGELDAALAATARLRELSERQHHPWGLATAKRCDAIVQLASKRHDEDADALLQRAAEEYGELGLRYDRARSLLALGRAQRRHRKWAAARSTLGEAAAAFDEIGSTGWAEEARAEVGRVGARRPRVTGELTPSERRVVELAAEGLANKEIAGSLVVSVHTVEVHLSHAYAKLGVRSRGQLARRMAERR